MPCISFTVQNIGSEEMDIMPGAAREESKGDIVRQILVCERDSLRADIDAYDGEVGEMWGQQRMQE